MANRYLEAASEGVPLRYVCGILVTLIAVTSPIGSGGLIDAVVAVKVVDLFSLDYWTALEVRVGTLFLAASFVAMGVMLERCLAVVLFKLAARISSYRERVANEYRSLASQKSQAESRASRLQLLDGAIKPIAKRFNSSIASAQLCFTVGFLILLFGRGVLDVCVALATLSIGVMRTIVTVRVFFSEYYPMIAMRNLLRGVPPPLDITDQEY